MKRLLSALLCCVLLCVTVLPIGATAKNSSLSVTEFAQKAASLCEKYNMPVNTINGGKSTDNSVGEESEFSLCRVIVRSFGAVPDKGAVAAIRGYRDLTVLQYATPQKAEAAYRYYLTCPSVMWAEPDKPIRQSETITDASEPARGTLSWGSKTVGTYEIFQYLENNEIEMNSVSVGIIDSGLDLNHPVFDGRLVDNGVNLSATGDETGMSDDPDSHGTHVAGILADNTPDAVKLKPYKVFDKYGNSTELLAATALDLAVDDGMDVVNFSLTGDNTAVFAESVENAYKNGVTVVAAMGNEGKLISDIMPASSPHAIAVGSVGSNGTVSYFSNYADFIDIVAPGESIYSAVNGGKYAFKSGTSMATSYVTAAACLLLAMDDSLTPDEVKNRLVTYAAAPADGVINSQKYGAGVVNIAEAFNGPRLENVNSSLPAGDYTGPCFAEFDLSEGQTLHYTTDGSLPTQSSDIYTAPLTFAEDTVLRWFVEDDNSGLFRSVSSMACFTVDFAYDESAWETDENGFITAYRGVQKIVYVPEMVGDIPVSGIGPHAFAGQVAEEIYLPQSVSTIDEYAFYQCDRLKKISASGVKRIGKYAFAECLQLTDFDFTYVTEVDENVFDGCGITDYEFFELSKCEAVFPKNSRVVLPLSVTALPDESLEGCCYYGYADSYAAQWAAAHNAEFVALNASNTITDDVAGEWAEGDEPLSVSAVGSCLIYRWYGCRKSDKTDTILLAGADGPSLDPAAYVPCCYYYCTVTAYDGERVLYTAESSLCYRFVAADYSALKRTLSAVPADLSVYTKESVAALQAAVDAVDYDLDAANQETVDEATGKVNEALQNLQKKFFLIIWLEKLLNFILSLFDF